MYLYNSDSNLKIIYFCYFCCVTSDLTSQLRTFLSLKSLLIAVYLYALILMRTMSNILISLYTHTDTDTNTHIYTNTHTYTYTHAHTHTHTHTHTCTNIQQHISISVLSQTIHNCCLLE